MGDCDRLRQATWHLVSNAVKFTPDGGRVAVVLGVGPEGAHLAVADTGAGIAPEVLPRLVAGEAANGSSRASGLGLGLSLVRHIVELHGGVLSAESPGLGAGATFRVRLPPARTSNGDAAHVSAPRLDGVRVVVVDERADARGLVASALLRAGASVVTAASGQYALLLMRDDSRDVFVVNVGTRDRSGYWVAREALAVALNRGERLTIIAIGAPGKGGADRPAEIGIERHLASPVDPAELVRAIADSVRQSPNRQVGR
jgi:CheY-like chemotaxis protein